MHDPAVKQQSYLVTVVTAIIIRCILTSIQIVIGNCSSESKLVGERKIFIFHVEIQEILEL